MIDLKLNLVQQLWIAVFNDHFEDQNSFYKNNGWIYFYSWSPILSDGFQVRKFANFQPEIVSLDADLKNDFMLILQFLRKCFQQEAPNTSARMAVTRQSSIWDITSWSRRDLYRARIGTFSAMRARCRRMSAARQTMSTLVPIISGLSCSASTPCMFETSLAWRSTSSMNSKSRQTVWRSSASARAMLLSACTTCDKSPKANSWTTCVCRSSVSSTSVTRKWTIRENGGVAMRRSTFDLFTHSLQSASRTILWREMAEPLCGSKASAERHIDQCSKPSRRGKQISCGNNARSRWPDMHANITRLFSLKWIRVSHHHSSELGSHSSWLSGWGSTTSQAADKQFSNRFDRFVWWGGRCLWCKSVSWASSLIKPPCFDISFSFPATRARLRRMFDMQMHRLDSSSWDAVSWQNGEMSGSKTSSFASLFDPWMLSIWEKLKGNPFRFPNSLSSNQEFSWFGFTFRSFLEEQSSIATRGRLSIPTSFDDVFHEGSAHGSCLTLTSPLHTLEVGDLSDLSDEMWVTLLPKNCFDSKLEELSGRKLVTMWFVEWPLPDDQSTLEAWTQSLLKNTSWKQPSVSVTNATRTLLFPFFILTKWLDGGINFLGSLQFVSSSSSKVFMAWRSAISMEAVISKSSNSFPNTEIKLLRICSTRVSSRPWRPVKQKAEAVESS